MIQTKNILDSDNIEELKAEIKTLNRVIELMRDDMKYNCSCKNDVIFTTDFFKTKYRNGK